MVERKTCSFCGNEIEPGTGRMYIKKDGTIYNFCSSKCRKNLILLRRVPRWTEWTRLYVKGKKLERRAVKKLKPSVRPVIKEKESKKV
jgi:large subunit ribosomal protein L24e